MLDKQKTGFWYLEEKAYKKWNNIKIATEKLKLNYIPEDILKKWNNV